MPIYEYQCQSCGETLEKLQRMSDAPLTDCPECGKAELKRLVSAAAFRLKGSGWYETDFKQDNKRNLADGGDGKDGKGKADKGKADGDAGSAKDAGKASDAKSGGDKKSDAKASANKAATPNKTPSAA